MHTQQPRNIPKSMFVSCGFVIVRFYLLLLLQVMWLSCSRLLFITKWLIAEEGCMRLPFLNNRKACMHCGRVADNACGRLCNRWQDFNFLRRWPIYMQGPTSLIIKSNDYQNTYSLTILSASTSMPSVRLRFVDLKTNSMGCKEKLKLYIRALLLWWMCILGLP